MTGVVVTDPFTDGVTPLVLDSGDTDNDGELDLDETWVYYASYEADQDDVDAGDDIVNTAYVNSNETEEEEASATTTITQIGKIAITKSASVDSEDDCYDTGDVVTYAFTVYNTGNVTLTDVVVSEYHFTGTGELSDIDFVESSEASLEGTLLPGENATYTATYTITLEDTDARFINNQAQATAIFGENEVDDLSGDTVDSDNETQVDLCQQPDLDIIKTVVSNEDILNGKLTFEIKVTNTGNTTLYNVYVEDEMTEDQWTIDELAPEEFKTFTVEVNISQEMIDGECYENTAIAESREFLEDEQSPGQGEGSQELLYRVVAFDEDDISACFTQTPGLTIVKEITDGDPYSLVGDAIDYKYTVTNSGNVTLDGPFTVNDDKIGVIADATQTSTLAPGEMIEFTATYIVKEADLSDGKVTNIATGLGYFEEEEVVSDPDDATAEASFNDILAVDDFAGTFDYETNLQTSSVNALANDELNGGQATTANVSLTTVIADPEGILSVDANGVITIAANAPAGDYQLTYRITEIGNPSNYDEAVITATVNPVLLIDEIESYCELDAPYLRWLLEPANFNLQDLAPGDPNPLTMIWYDKDDNEIIRFDNIPMEGYMLFPGADTLPGGYGSQWPGWRFVNEQWESGDFNYAAVREAGSYVLFQLNPEVSSEIAYPGASSECNPNPNPPIAIDDDMTSIPVVSEDGYANIVNVLDNDQLGAIVGLNTTLVDISIVAESTPGAITIDLNTGLASVAPGTPSGIYTIEYRICTNPNPTNCDTAIVTVLVVTPSIELLKDGVFNDENQDGFGNVGETVSYTFTVINTGDVELNNITIDDDKVTVMGGPLNGLAAGASDSNTFTATYILTQDDIDNGLVLNSALAKGEGPRGYPVEDESSDPTPVEEPSTECETCTETEIPQNPAIELLKDGEFNDENQDGFGNVGETISYTFTVSNTGNVTLSNIMVTDPMVTVNGGPISLAPGASDNTTFTATYVLTQDDIDAGYVVNTALAQGTSPKDEVVEDESSDPTPVEEPSTECETCTETEIPQNPAIELLKDGEFNDENQDGFGNVGETISYTFTVINTGNVTLSNIMVTDPMVTVSGGPISLAPGASDNTTFTATYVLSQDDIDAGYVVNTALAQGTSPKDEVVEDESSDPTPVEEPNTECETCTETEIPQNPAIELLKDGEFNDENQDGFGNVGETISYTFTVTNTGNVTLSNINVTDPMVTVSGGPISLSPGASDNTTFTATYILTQDDIDAGYVVNTALAQGTSPKDEVVEDESSDPTPVEEPNTECETCTETEIPQNPAINVVKTDNGAVVDAAGDVITYTLTVSNTGNVTLSNVMINDPLTGLDVNVGTLTPGQSIAQNTDYVVTQQDMDNGTVLNTVITSGESPDGEDPTDEDEIETPVERLPNISLTKEVDLESVSKAGIVLNYTLVVKNTGNVTLSSGDLKDPKTGLSVPGITLAPNEEKTFTTTYTVTLEDILSGQPILNIANVIAVDPQSEETVEAEAQAIVNIDLQPAVSIEKVADKEVVTEAGEVITYTISVTNTGTAPLLDVAVVDPMTGLDETIELLLPEATQVFTTTYTVTVEDIAQQEPIVNVAMVTAPNPVDPESPLEEEDDATVIIGCEDSTLITGIAYNSETGAPLSGVPVTLIPQESTPGEILIVVTGEDGRYTFQDFVPGQYLVQVQDANLNAARGLYPTESSLFFTFIEACQYQTHDFGYETYDGIVLGDFVWYDLNEDGIQNEWFDANDDGQVTLNDPNAGPIDIRDWEWFDLNGDGRYDGPENEGELNKAGFGNAQSSNIKVTGPNGYESEVIVGIIGYWRDRLDNGAFGEYTATMIEDEFISAQASFMRSTGKVKVLPDASARMTDINASRIEEQCGLTTVSEITREITASNKVALDMDFGWSCREVEIDIIANDDDFGTHFLSFGGRLGNILDNDIFEGQRPDPADVDFEFVELDGVIGLLIDEDGELNLIPGVNEAREYRLRYILREAGYPENNDDAYVVFRLENDNVNLSITKEALSEEVYEGDEFEYEIVLSNIGGFDARNVVVTDNLPGGVNYLSNTVTNNSANVEVSASIDGSNLVWTIPFFPADATITFTVKVKAGEAGTVTNTVIVGADEDDSDESDNQDSAVTEILPFHIPNVITPNNDGDNDTFEIKGLGKFVNSEIVILNRFGDHVLEKTGYQNDWDAPGQVAGTYFYILKLTDQSGRVHEFQGWIQVIKED
nr:gliding motility-associated C-terminal domain-containing protein [Algoriphagus vanfongensis]